MSRKSVLISVAVSLCLSLTLLGCTTGSIHHFNPSPAASVRSQNLEPAKPRLISELVRSAQKEFEEANAAQEKGEREASVQHYAKMLDLLKEANLDPAVFYKLRSEFERIVSSRETPPAPAPEAQNAAAATPAEGVQQAFQTANEAQEKGDHEAALREYTHMLELLSKEGLDPAAFYGLRSEFERILATGEKQARLYDRQRENQWKRNNQAPGPMGDIEIEEPLSDHVLTEIDEIMNLYPRNFQGGLDRSFKYLPYVKEQFAQAGLPEDLVWLAMVESQFSPKVVSRAGASGMWQFMKATGTRYDLKVDRYVDERFNWQKATQAATRMLTELYEHFDGNWPLAVSAYNMGEGGIDRAVASCGGERNLWKLVETSPASEMMQTETKKFYPKLLASIIVAKDPERFGFASNPQPAEETARVPIHGSYALNALERALELPDGTLRQLNPDLIRGVTPPSGEFPLAVPAEASEKIASVISDLPQVRPEILRGWDRKQTYIVRRGETLDVIAKKCGVSVEDLMKANRLKADSRLSSGRKITVPGDNFSLDQLERIKAADDDEPAAAPEEKPQAEAAAAPKREPGSMMKTYTVKPGDTLETIAKKQKVSLKDLLQWNKIKDQAKINAGDQLKLNSIEELQEKQESAEKTYVVQPGDSPAKIAKLCGVELDDLLQWNRLSKTTPIHEGEKLVIHGIQPQEPEDKGPDAPPATSTEKSEYKVAKGDTASSIADKYGVKVSEFLSWNKLTPKSVIREGDTYTVFVKAESPKAAPAAKSKDAKVAKAAPEAKPKAAEKEAARPEPKKDTKTAKAAPETKPKAAEKKEEVKPGPKKDTKTAKADAPKKDAAPKDAPAAKKTTHVVGKGDTPSTIADRYKVKLSDLYKWNNWGKNVVLQIGQKVAVQKD